MRNKQGRRRVLFAAALSALIVSCVREKPAPPPATQPKPTATKREPLVNRDVAGTQRNTREGITPGALEPSGPPSDQPKKAQPKRGETR